MRKILFFAVAAVFALVLPGCASLNVLTPRAIDADIDGLDNLANCQYFISKDITLRFSSDDRQTGINEKSGVVRAERVIKNRFIKITGSTPGILQIKDNAGKPVKGYDIKTNQGADVLTLSVLFEKDNENIIQFRTFYNDKMHRFELFDREINYGGINYTVLYDGNDRPYLRYKKMERLKEQNEERTASGRRVGS